MPRASRRSAPTASWMSLDFRSRAAWRCAPAGSDRREDGLHFTPGRRSPRRWRRRCRLISARLASTTRGDRGLRVRAGAVGAHQRRRSPLACARLPVAAVKRARARTRRLVVMIENSDGLRAPRRDLCGVPGIDCVFIGPVRLSTFARPDAEGGVRVAAVARIGDIQAWRGVPLGGLSKSRSETYALKARGYEFVAVYSGPGRASLERVSSVLGPARQPLPVIKLVLRLPDLRIYISNL